MREHVSGELQLASRKGLGNALRRTWLGMLQPVLKLSDVETSAAKRGFVVDGPEVSDHLESIGRAFVRGYNAALATDETLPLVAELERVPLSHRGFAYEGAAMALAITDFLAPGRGRWREFANGPGATHIYMVQVGLGLAFARLPLRPMKELARLQSSIKWLSMDGLGFHSGYFTWPQYVSKRRQYRGLRGYAIKAFDQGLGRSLWFVAGANPSRIASRISMFEVERRGDLWAGVGLAASYAGGCTIEHLRQLQAEAAEYVLHLRQGAAFAVEARSLAQNLTDHTRCACEIFCGEGAERVAALVRGFAPIHDDIDGNEYEGWRTKLRHHFRRGVTGYAAQEDAP